MSKGNQQPKATRFDMVEDRDMHINQLKGLVSLFVGVDLNTITPKEHAGASWLLSDLVNKVDQTIQAIEQHDTQSA